MAQSQGRLQRLDRQLMPLERFSMDEKQELVNKPSSSFPTPRSNDSEGCCRVCLSEELQHELPTAQPALLCTISRLVSFHQNSSLPHCAPVPHPSHSLATCTTVITCRSALGGVQTRRVSRLHKRVYIQSYPCFAFTMEGKLAGYRILPSLWNTI